MSVERVEFLFTSDSAGKGTAFSPYPIEGRILEWVAPNPGATALFGPGSTATFTVTRTAGAGGGSGTTSDGGTVLAMTAQIAPWRVIPRSLLQTVSGGTTVGVAGSAGLYDLAGGIPSADYLTAIMTQGGSSVAGTVFMYYDRDRAS